MKSARPAAILAVVVASACVGTIGGNGGEPAPDAATDGHDVGPTPLRRLTRLEYDRTVADLLGVDVSPATDFAPDELVGAFASNAVAPVGALQVELYMAAAEDLAAAADLSHLLPCDPVAIGEAACAASFIDHFGVRALRRALDEPLRADLDRAYQHAAGEGFEAAIRFVIETALQSPYFLYHVEDAPDGATGPVRLDGYALASRLSYFLWRSMPDDALFEAAAAGALDTPEGLVAQAERMLSDDRAAVSIAAFHREWLGLGGLEQLEKDPAVFPQLDDAMRAAMRVETERFADWVVRKGDGTLTALLTAAYSFPTGALLDLYGVASGASGEPVPLDPAQRSGLLTHASLLASLAHAAQTSPVARGVFVRENLMCMKLPPPPENVDNVPPDPDPSLTTRERFAVHTADPSCASCHQLIDGVGLGFEHYDALGAYRATENGKPVDASGLIVGSDVAGEFDGVIELGARLAASNTVHECVVRQWFRFALGRSESEHDETAIGRLEQSFTASTQSVRALLVAIVASDAFAYRRADTTTEQESP